MKSYRKTLLISGVCLAACAGPVVSRAATFDVDMVGFAFSPANATVNVGDSVRWTQRDADTAHTSTSGSPPGVPDGRWDSGFLNPNNTFVRQFNIAGNFPYYCDPHSFSMSGSITVQAGSNAPPAVSITNPTNGAVFSGAPASVVIEATASDPNGTVAQVEFFDGTNSLGVDLASPYTVTANLSPGGHTLTAVATDNASATTVSAGVSVTVNTVPIDNPIAERIPKGDIAVDLQTVVDGLAAPLGLAAPDDGSGRLFVYDQEGRAWVVVNGAKLPTPLLDVRNRLVLLGAYDERGLLGMAAHPQFATHPFIYTYTSESNSGAADFTAVLPGGVTHNHQSVIAEWRIDPANTNQVDPSTRREILRIDKPQSNHNGGTMRFGADGFLYISLGDGGSADDQGNGHLEPGGNAQSIDVIYGKVLRIDVNGTNSANGKYGVPTDNPFVGLAGVDEIYAYGLRNPFNFSFDRMSGELYLGDVGQNKVEEIDIIMNGGNYGWNVKEGTFFFDPNGAGAGYVTATPVGPVPPNLIDPIAQYDHDDGLAVVGGFVYRGAQITPLQGRYLFGDWGSFGTPSGRLYYLDASNAVKEVRIGLEDRPLNSWLRGFGEDSSGELYVFVSRVLGPSGTTGKMLKVIRPPDPIQITSTTVVSNNLAIAWTGGAGPFALQKKKNLAEPICGNVAFTTQREALTPIDESAAFFRVADTANQPVIPLTATLSGLGERPTPLTNAGFGSATFRLEGNAFSFDISYGGLSGNATAAHIHGPATAALSAGILIDLAPFNGGSYGSNGAVSGSVILTAAQKAMVLGGRTYVNFHTVANGGGEIRGQITPVAMQALINGANERPDPVTTPATAVGTFALSGSDLTFNITYRGLSGPAIAAHIHGPASASQSVGVLVNLAPFNGGSFGSSGTMAGRVALTASQLAAVVDGLTYVNIHTSAHPDGEVRGQILPQATAVPLTASLSGLNERPTPLTNAAIGAALFKLEGNVLTFSLNYGGLSGTATAAHIHGPASASTAAGILIDLMPYNGGAFSTNDTLSGSILLTASQKALVLSGQTYANVHTAANPGGELRGQIAPVLMSASISGGNERLNAILTAGNGTATLALVGDQLRFNVTYRGLSGPATAAHIHGPASALASAGILIDFSPFNGGAYGASGSLSGTATLTPSQLAAVIDGLTYINFHTPANSGGEMRGQISR